MDVPIKLIRKFSRSGKSIQVILEDGRFLWIPRWALLHDYQPGERDIVIEARYGLWAQEMEQEEWKRQMALDVDDLLDRVK